MTIERRDLLTYAALAGAGLIAREAAAADPAKPKAAAGPSPLAAAYAALLDAAGPCIRTGKNCLARCADHLAAGMTNMVDCQKSVMNMLEVVEAMSSIASYATADAKNAKALAAACSTFCKACQKECEKHAKMHEECKACGDACAACAAACDKLVALA